MLLGVLLLLAQAPDLTTLSGTSGWVGTGLLGAVLAWVFFVHLPAKDKKEENLLKVNIEQIRDINTQHTIQIKELSSQYAQQIKELVARADASDRERRQDSKENLQMVISHCARETESLSKAVSESTMAISDLRDIMENVRSAIVDRIPK